MARVLNYSCRVQLPLQYIFCMSNSTFEYSKAEIDDSYIAAYFLIFRLTGYESYLERGISSIDFSLQMHVQYMIH